MPNVQLIIQARMTSTRLPGKVMLPLCGKPVLQVMIERLPSWRQQIIVATTNDGSEQPIVALCQQLGIRCYRGDTDDVLGRYYQAARHFGADAQTAIVRLTSDCPLIDDALTSQVIERYLQGGFDMVNLGPHSGYPRGLDCCVFSFALLERTHQLATHSADREHVTLGMAKFSDLRTLALSAGADLSHFRLTLDEPDDYLALQAVYAEFSDKLDFSYPQLQKVLKETPALYDINKHVQQKSV